MALFQLVHKPKLVEGRLPLTLHFNWFRHAQSELWAGLDNMLDVAAMTLVQLLIVRVYTEATTTIHYLCLWNCT